MERDGPGMLFAENLKDARYIRVVYGSLFHLGERFARVSPAALAEAKSIWPYTGLSVQIIHKSSSR